MSKERRSDLVIGIVLLLIGGWFLAAQFNLVPKLNEIINIQYEWPMIIIGVGILLFILGLLTRNPGMSVPACIVGGIGGILYYTNSTGQWGAWAYLWTLIPGFVGIGIILSTLLGGEERTGYREGLRLILISVIMFVIFFMLLSGQGNIIRYWPILVILAGIWIIVQTFFRKK
jgi:peptidoglycan/LPS O-acetylase OafA/YrhL